MFNLWPQAEYTATIRRAPPREDDEKVRKMENLNSEQKLAQLTPTVQQLKDRQDVIDVIVRESRGRDRHDVELIASCYWPDGADEHGPAPVAAPQYPEWANAGHARAF